MPPKVFCLSFRLTTGIIIRYYADIVNTLFKNKSIFFTRFCHAAFPLLLPEVTM